MMRLRTMVMCMYCKMDDIAKNDMKQIASSLAERGANYAKGAANNAPYNVKQAQAVADQVGH